MEARVSRSRRAVLLAAAVAAAVLLATPPPLVLGAAATVATAGVPSDGCTRRCGDISIPFPFGVERGCYLEPGFNLTCDRSHRPPKLFLGDGTVPVLNISIPDGAVHINVSFAFFPGSNGTSSTSTTPAAKPVTTSATWSGALDGGPYTLSVSRNRLLALGCDVQVVLGDSHQTVSTCAALCNTNVVDVIDGGVDCPSGVGCCQADIIPAGSSYRFRALQVYGAQGPRSETRAWIVDSELSIDPAELANSSGMLPAVLVWWVNSTTCDAESQSSPACRSDHSVCYNNKFVHGHRCYCEQGYEGNPYIPNGCKDINECDFPEEYPCYGQCKNTEGAYQCECPTGFEGNARIPNGCKDINECARRDLHSCDGICENMPGAFTCRCTAGTYEDPFTKGRCLPIKSSVSVLKVGLGVGGGTSLLLLALAAPFIMRKVKLQKVRKMKERFFKQNHGLLLQQLISQKSDIGGRMIITLRELEKATNNFDVSHEIGGGGHGVVYKGLLDLQVVAIKKSKIVVQREIDDFINEVAILSLINHRNIVKLLGCCLETEVPLLVYEFISNGTLAYHLHVEGPLSLTWDDRLRIALEISKALAYLHSAASTQILHRDIKSSNILLDDNLTAKVSDFGASRYIPVDQTGVTTAVQGTIGYLDPMYYYTGRLTDKSDVFSFGILLIELLTRKKPFLYRFSDGEGLVSHFASLLAEDNLVHILDPQIMEDDEDAQVHEVAALAAVCTKLNGQDRPTMRQVEMTLERLIFTKRSVHHNTTSRRKYDRDQSAAHYMSFEGHAVETSRQYTMEEEMLLSARYPR